MCEACRRNGVHGPILEIRILPWRSIGPAHKLFRFGIINHHLLCADLAIKEEGFGELLPGAEAFIIDEAHQLPETAARFFGISLSSRQLQELAQDSKPVAQGSMDEGDVELF